MPNIFLIIAQYIASLIKYLKKLLKIEINYTLLSLCIFIHGCGLGSHQNQTNTNINSTTTSNIPNSNQKVEISNIATIPSLINTSNNEYIIAYVTNKLNTTITLKNIQISNSINLHSDSSLITPYINTINCKEIAPISSCKLKIYIHKPNGSYLLNMIYSDKDNNNYSAIQIINTFSQLSDTNGFTYDRNNLTLYTQSNDTLSIPFRLNDDYTNISIMIDNNQVQFSCNNANFNKNNLCTVLINADDISVSNTRIHTFTITGSMQNGKKNVSTARLEIDPNQTAHIVTSGINIIINPDDGSSPQQVFLFNNGVESATNIDITAANPINISSNTCSSTLAAGATCSFYINVTGSIPSGQSNVHVSYNDGINTQTFYFNVSYISPIPSPSLTLSTNGEFTDHIINSGPAFLYINITNTGNNALYNMQFTNVNQQESSMSSNAVGTTCIPGQTLEIGDSCIMALSYNPASVASGTVNFIPVGTYTNQGGQYLTYLNSILTIPYSSISSSSFVAAGNFGIVLSSTAGNPAAWTTDVDSPFATTSIAANGMTINNSIYAITMSDGSVKYSNLNGLFWNSATATNLNLSSCGIVFDGTYYYTCGRSGSVLDNCLSTGRGCIIRTNNLTGTWAGIFQPPTARQSNDIFYFNNGTDKAYLATFAGNSSTTGLATSTDGNSFVITNTGLSGSNANLTAATYNSDSQLITIWSATGYNTANLISNITSNWTANGIDRPQNSSVNGAIYQNGLYSYVNSSGRIYTSINPAIGPYTQVYPPFGNSTQLNDITYGNGTYLAVGNTGTVVESNNTSGWILQSPFIIGQSSTTNLNSAYFDGSNFWVTGVNAISFTSTTVPPVWVTPSIVSIAENGSSYLAVDNQGHIYSSSNLSNWSELNNPSHEILNEVYCAGTNLCFAVGNNGTILKTTDGANWIQLTTTTTAKLNAITCQQGLCVAVGGTGSTNSGTALISANYTSWVVQNTNLPTTYINGISFYNNQFIAVGNSGSIFTSTNGADWTIATSGTTNNLNAIACGNGCAAVGNSGTIRYSSNGVSWVAATSNITNNLNAVTYNGTFVTVGNNGSIRYSSTGAGSWTAGTFPSTSSSTNNLMTVITQ